MQLHISKRLCIMIKIGMITTKKVLTTIMILIIVTSCLFDGGGETIKGRYNIGWIDTKANRSINYATEDGEYGGSEKIGAFIKRMGHSERFIIAERIYYDAFAQMDKPNHDSSAFYIIDMEKESLYKDEDVIGPFNKVDFQNMKIKLGIKDLEFTNEYYDY